jgi:hypothetical protein
MTITKFTIYGERCSGTNFLEETIIKNFNITPTWEYGWKHFFGFYNFSKNNNECDETLFIGIIRNPINWLYSFNNNPYHIPDENKILPNFLLNEFYSVKENNEIMENDLNYLTNKKYKNIFEMRKIKNDYLINIIPLKVKNYIFIRYEDLVEDPENLINIIKNNYNLKLSNNYIFKVDYCSKDKNKKFKEKKVNFSEDILNIIKDNLDIDQEKKLNYNI